MPADIFGHVPSPPGTIAYWDDDPANLPAGWVVCDGNNGTPDLLDEFVKTTPDSSTNPGNVGGQHSHTLSISQLGTHDHYTGTTDSTGAHNHVFANNECSDCGTDIGDGVEYAEGPDDNYDNTYSTSQGDHSHTLNLGNSGSGNSIENRPTYHELVPVMKT